MEFLERAYDFIRDNRDIFFGGIGTSLLGWLGLQLFPSKNKSGNAVETSNNNTNNLTINNNISPTKPEEQKGQICKHTPEERKRLTKILFIDDEEFKVVKILKSSGWINVRSKKHVKGPDDSDILNADICFVDIYGVATNLYEKDQGLGLVGAIKDRHPHKKVVVYSSQEKGDVFNELWNKADARLSKNAEPYQFENLLENFSEEIYC